MPKCCNSSSYKYTHNYYCDCDNKFYSVSKNALCSENCPEGKKPVYPKVNPSCKKGKCTCSCGDMLHKVKVDANCFDYCDNSLVVRAEGSNLNRRLFLKLR